VTDNLVVDDHLLLRVLLQDEPPELRPDGAVIATTGLWYHRLCRALSDQTVVGSISRRLGHVEDTVAADLIRAVIELPDAIELLSLRSLGWPMAEIVHGGARLNLLSLEALAAAQHLGAEICLADVDANQPLVASSRQSGVTVRTIPD
jgi:hypothetical protein